MSSLCLVQPGTSLAQKGRKEFGWSPSSFQIPPFCPLPPASCLLLTEQELVELNQKIVARLKFLASARNHKEMLKFTIGEKVSFEAPGQGRQVGLLVKYNKKTVTVIT